VSKFWYREKESQMKHKGNVRVTSSVIVFEFANSIAVSLSKPITSGGCLEVDERTRLSRLFVHLPFSVRSLNFTRVYEGHFMLVVLYGGSLFWSKSPKKSSNPTSAGV